MTIEQFIDLLEMHLDTDTVAGRVLINLLQTYFPSLYGQLADTMLDCSYAYSVSSYTFQATMLWLAQNWDNHD